MLLPIAVFVVAGQTGGASATASAGGFPAFIKMPGVTPSGLAVDKVSNVYVSIRETIGGILFGKIWKYTPAGEQSLFAEIGTAEIYGLAVASNGDLYAAMARVGSDKGVYRVDRKGQIELLPGSDQIVFANALAFDDRGTLYITESYSGAPIDYGQGGIWRIPRGGEAELWIRHGLDFPASLAFGTGKGERTNLFVTNLGLGKNFVPQLPWAGPGLVKIDAGVPGRPVH